MQKKIEIIELDAGLYKLQAQFNIMSTVCAVSQVHQWHTRLGHLSLSVIKKISEIDVQDSHNASVCDADFQNKPEFLSL